MGTLGDYEEFLAYERANLSRTTKLLGVGLAGLMAFKAGSRAAAEAMDAAFRPFHIVTRDQLDGVSRPGIGLGD